MQGRDFLFEFHLKFGIPPVLVFQIEVYYKVEKFLTGPYAQQKGTTAWWYSNKTSLQTYYPYTEDYIKDSQILFGRLTQTQHSDQTKLMIVDKERKSA